MGLSIYHRTFISHAHADNTICAQIADRLREIGVDVWIDLNNAQKGQDLSADITRELLGRSAFVMMVTPASDRSRWVGMELSNFIAFRNDQSAGIANGQARIILPVLLEAVQLGPESNWARIYGVNWINGIGRDVNEIVSDVAKALTIAVSGQETPEQRRKILDKSIADLLPLQIPAVLLVHAIYIELARDADIAQKMASALQPTLDILAKMVGQLLEIFSAEEIAQSLARLNYYRQLFSQLSDNALSRFPTSGLGFYLLPLPPRPQGQEYACSEEACIKSAMQLAHQWFPELYGSGR